MTPPILLIAAFVAFIAEGAFFPVGHHGQPVGADAKFDQIVPHCLGPLFTQHEIVRQRAALVAMPFDLH